MLAEMNLAWTEVDPQRVVRAVEAQFILLVMRQGEHQEAVEAKLIWAADLGGAQNEARCLQLFDSTVSQVTILDGLARQVMSVVTAEPRGSKATQNPLSISRKRNWSRPAYH